MVDERPKVDIDSLPRVGGDPSLSEMNSIETTAEKRHLQWTASTIRPICRTFMNFPHDRDLPLNVPGTSGKIYNEVIRKLSSDIILYSSSHIFVAPLYWNKPEEVEGKIIIKLNCGLWNGNKLVQHYRLIVNSTAWSHAKKNYILTELELSIEEAKKQWNMGDRLEKSWVFFMGEQDSGNQSDFIITDHRLICCLTGELFRYNTPLHSK